MTKRHFSMVLTAIGLVALGGTALAQTGNTTNGTGAGVSITSGDFNTLIGDSAGTNLTTGSGNAFLGKNAGREQIRLSDNVFIGRDAGLNNGITNPTPASSLGQDNVFIGAEAGRTNTTGFDNTFVGAGAGFSNITGADNTFVVKKPARIMSAAVQTPSLAKMQVSITPRATLTPS